jgi:hypothetical protein
LIICLTVDIGAASVVDPLQERDGTDALHEAAIAVLLERHRTILPPGGADLSV